jgi:cytochrome c-type biogenesis protein CcmH/NrfG
MRRLGAGFFLFAAVVAAPPPETGQLAPITIDYPAEGSVFPPDMTAPTFLWRDPAAAARAWTIEVTFAGGAAGLRAQSRGERLRIGEIDARAMGPTNEPPRLTPEQAAARTWRPDAEAWTRIKELSVEHPATVTITGFRDREARRAVSRGRVSIRTSRDPVGAPIFYRDVPLMPSEAEQGVIKPLAPSAQPLVAWRLRNVGEPRSRLLLEGLATCANCHSFSRDGATLGMDLDGPQNDKGIYAIARVAPRMVIRDQDVISWHSFDEQPAGRMRVGFMSQISPDGRYVVTTVGGTEKQIERNYYVANFKDYRFLQVFYATRGILVWYDRVTGRRQALPGADDPRYVQTNAVWSPDGSYLVFARAEARDAYPEGRQTAEYANDPRETQVQYDLYRIPFNGGKGGKAEPIAGASGNGMSNSFPKVSPDGRWIVFVQARNGLLMRPDSQLYIVPAEGGPARRLRSNTPRMNSWHSFSPNGRWLVFASKGRTPYTEMFLTHLDEEGNDSPAILIENATAANRAVNIPEFVNIPPDGLAKIEVPVSEFYRLFDRAWELGEKGQYAAAIAEWHKALEMSPNDAKAHNNLAFALAKSDRIDEAIGHWRKALAANPEYAVVYSNLGRALVEKGSLGEAIVHLRKAIEIDPQNAAACYNLGNALYMQGKVPEALEQWRAGLRIEPALLPALNQVAWVLATSGEAGLRNGSEAVRLAARAVELSGGREPNLLYTLAAAYAEAGRFQEAVQTARRALALARAQNLAPLADEVRARIALYESGKPFRSGP